MQAKDDFYAFVNDKWLNDESVVIPKEYPSWGTYVQLHDESLKHQIEILKEAREKKGAELGKDEAKLKQVWEGSMARFETWEKGGGNYDYITKELKILEEAMAGEGVPLAQRVAKYSSHALLVGITTFLDFGVIPNMDDPEHEILQLGGDGLSLPRDYYFKDEHAEKLQWFKEHIQKAAELVGLENLKDNFAERVVRLETKLARISMTPEQRRCLNEFYTVTSLGNLVTGAADLKHLPDKDKNYADPLPACVDGSTDAEVLTSSSWTLSDKGSAAMDTFMEEVYANIDLRQVMETNFKKNYPQLDPTPENMYRILVFDGDYFRRVFDLLGNDENEDDLVAFFQYCIMSSGSGSTTKELKAEWFDFYSRKLSGQQEQKTPEKQTTMLIDSWLGDLLGKIYVERYFPEQEKATVRAMVRDVIQTLKESIENADWLTSETKSEALLKLSKFREKIGYTDKWEDFDKLVFKPEATFAELKSAVTKFKLDTKFFKKVNCPKDETEWILTPQTVNAYFHLLNNEVVFTAAILQAPFYTMRLEDVKYDFGLKHLDTKHLLQAINFGGIGAVIAHEITHGFDNKGRMFDHKGSARDWWCPEDEKRFQAKAELMNDQAKAWKVELEKEGGGTTEHKMSHELTLGENLADLGGLSLSFKTFMKQLDPATPEADRKLLQQLFFSSWANIWKAKESREIITRKLATDPHAPPNFRGNLVRNIDAFYTAFDVSPGDPMYLPPEERVYMW